MMKKIILFLWLLLITIGVKADFLPGTDDIPLMDGIALSDTTDFAFDTPAGQILMFDGRTERTPAQIRAFYDKTLTALGWSLVKRDFYGRGTDELRLSFPGKGQVRFDITLTSGGQ